jgi:hypothetical protein
MRLGRLGRMMILTAGFFIVQGSEITQGGILAIDVGLTTAAEHSTRKLGSGPRTGIAAFLLSPQGRHILRASHHPMAMALLRRLGEEPSSAPQTIFREVPPAGTASSTTRTIEPSIGCGTASGTRFNLEPRVPPDALPQDSTAVDFLIGAGSQGGDLVVGAANDFRGFFGGLGDSATGYYVHRNGADANPCTPEFEGGLPQIIDRATGEALMGGGDPVIEADPTRSAVYMADIRIGQQSSTIGLFRATAANLNSPTACPNGTHNASSAKTCWPTSVEVNPVQAGLNLTPHIAVDSRITGSAVGAGDVYVSGTFVSPLSGALIFIAACKNDLSACSPAVIISGSDSATDSSHVRIRPDIATKANGSVTVTYVNISEGPPPDFLQIFDIKYVTCTPAGAPAAPTCSSPKLITSETQPVPSKGGGLGGGNLAAAQFMIATFPKHDHRQDQNGVETYVVWDRCKVALVQGGDVCPDADVILAASKDNGQTWQFGNVDVSAGDQYFPWIVTDTSTNIVNIAYYSTVGDKMNHRGKVLLTQILPGPLTPDPVTPAQILTTIAMEPSGDFFLRNTFIGNRIGVSARGTPVGSRAYVHYMHNIVNGTYNGVPAPEQNNHLSQFSY